MMIRRLMAATVSAAVLAAVGVAGAQEEGDPWQLVPLRAQAGPVVAPPLGPEPRSEIWLGAGVRFSGEEVRGRAEYSELQTGTVLGGEWSPSRLDRLGVGGDITVFQLTRVSTAVPPAIDEDRTYADLGPSRLFAKVKALALGGDGSFRITITPFARFGLPTDTSRAREERRMPVRAVIDDRVVGGPYFSIEPGVSAGFAVGFFSAYLHQSLPIVPVHDQDVTHLFLANHLGVGVLIIDHFEIVGELTGLFRLTEAHDGERLAAWAASPGLRWVDGALSVELSARFGLGDDSRDPFGLCTIFAGLAWTFK